MINFTKLGGANNFKIARKQIDSCGNARSKQQAAEERIEKLRKEETKCQQFEIEEKEKAKNVDTLLLDIETKLKVCEMNMKVAENIIEEGNVELKKHVSSQNIDVKNITIAQSKIEIGLNRKRSLQVEMDELIAKKGN